MCKIAHSPVPLYQCSRWQRANEAGKHRYLPDRIVGECLKAAKNIENCPQDFISGSKPFVMQLYPRSKGQSAFLSIIITER